MTHIDRDHLALIAMADFDLTESERQHTAACHECALDLISLQHIVAVGRSARTVELATPRDEVWTRIHSELRLSAETAATPRIVDDVTDEGEEETSPPPIISLVAPSVPVADSDNVSDIRSRTRRRVWFPVAVAAGVIGLVAGLGGGLWWDSLQTSSVPVIAEAQLEPFPGWDASGSVQVERSADGHRDVVVNLTAAPAGAELREVWLIKADASALISIGLLDGDSGRFSIPAAVDLAQYSLVDVSAEPDDGNPAHSSDSIVRGELHTL